MLKVLAGSALISLAAYMVFDSTKEDFKPSLPLLPPIHFLTEQQTRHLLVTDFDQFGLGMNDVNLRAVGVDDINECLEKWGNSATGWTNTQKKKVQAAIELVERKMQGMQKFSQGFKNNMNDIDWNVACTIYPYYLQGLPHTRGDIIFITDKLVATTSLPQLAGILMHEKTHIWQRKFPSKMEQWMSLHGFEKSAKVSSTPLERRNPDINEYLYKNQEGDELGVKFSNKNPADLNDVENYSLELDHPYEQFASKVQSMLVD